MARSFVLSRGVAGAGVIAVAVLLSGCGGGSDSGVPVEPPPRLATVTVLAGDPLTSGNVDGVGNTARFNTLRGIVVDAAGNLYVADQRNHAIRKITPLGQVSAFVGNADISDLEFRQPVDGIGSAARLLDPAGMAMDATGDIYFTDTHWVRKVTPSGQVTTLAYLPTPAQWVDGRSFNRFLLGGVTVTGHGAVRRRPG